MTKPEQQDALSEAIAAREWERVEELIREIPIAAGRAASPAVTAHFAGAARPAVTARFAEVFLRLKFDLIDANKGLPDKFVDVYLKHERPDLKPMRLDLVIVARAALEAAGGFEDLWFQFLAEAAGGFAFLVEAAGGFEFRTVAWWKMRCAVLACGGAAC